MADFSVRPEFLASMRFAAVSTDQRQEIVGLAPKRDARRPRRTSVSRIRVTSFQLPTSDELGPNLTCTANYRNRETSSKTASSPRGLRCAINRQLAPRQVDSSEVDFSLAYAAAVRADPAHQSFSSDCGNWQLCSAQFGNLSLRSISLKRGSWRIGSSISSTFR